MAVQQEIKSQLAKLLATEDLVVEHKHVETAQFNVDTRVLILPVWEKASNSVYDMLVAHEVGHALFTPNVDPPKDIPHNFLNVCEDARIEKMIKRKYAGLPKIFYRAYSELHESDFFSIENEDLDTFNLADRANLYFKIGSFIDISFTTREREIINLIDSCQTFDDVIEASRQLYEYCKERLEDQKKKVADIDFHQQPKSPDMDMNDMSQDGEGEGEEEEGKSQGESEQTPQMDESGQKSKDQPSIPENNDDDLDVKTAESLQSQLQNLTKLGQGVENVYVTLPKVKIDSIIADNEEIHNTLLQHWDIEKVKTENMIKEYGVSYRCPSYNPFQEVDSEYFEFKRNASKEVNYLVKEFECKKAASSYARASTARTGILDTTKLHTYKYNEDLFKKVTILPDGKNHGLVFILDWSGSMSHIMLDTIRQLFNLVWFCKKVNIPFDVYAFTNEYNRTNDSYYVSGRGLTGGDIYTPEEYQMVVDEHFSLMNLLTSKVNGKKLEKQMQNVWRLAYTFGQRFNCRYDIPRNFQLSGTPLNETLIALHSILPRFQKENKLEKVQCVILTDGEASQLPYHIKVDRSWEDEPYMGSRNVNPDRVMLRDRKLGATYKFGWSYHDFTKTFLNNLKDSFPTVNFIGIRVIPKSQALRFAKMYASEYSKEYRIMERDWRKSKSFSIKNSGYDTYFTLSAENLADDVEFDVNEDATKAQIKRAFVKSLKTKKLNKKVLGEFISLVV